MQTVVEDGMIANLTCPLCLSLFTNPRSMRSCPHTFCWDCLNSLEEEEIFQHSKKIKCPQCRQYSNFSTFLASTKATEFQTNVVIQNIVEIVKNQLTAIEVHRSGENACLHFLQAEKRSQCPHCSREFCDPCRIVHMEELKVSSLKGAKTVLEKCSSISADETVAKLEAVIGEEVSMAKERVTSAVEKAKQAFENALNKQMNVLFEQMDNFKVAQYAGLKEFVQQLAGTENLARLSEQRDEVASKSVLDQTFDNVANLSLGLAEQTRLISSFEAFTSAGSSVLQFELNPEIDRILVKLEKLNLGTVKLAPTAIDIGCRLSSYPHCDVKDSALPDETAAKLPVAPIESPEEDRPVSPSSEHYVVEEGSSGDFVGFLASDEEGEAELYFLGANEVLEEEIVGESGDDETEDSSRNENEMGIEKGDEGNEQPVATFLKPRERLKMVQVKKVIPLPDKKLFAILHENQISLFNPVEEKVVESFSFGIDVEKKSFEIDDLATDDRNTIFFTASYVKDGVPKRSIYRFWTVQCSPVSPTVYATASQDSYRGVVISKEWGYVVTTEGEDVVVYSSINTLKYSDPTKVFTHHLGPQPNILGIREISHLQFHLICSSDSKVMDRIMSRPHHYSNEIQVEDKEISTVVNGQVTKSGLQVAYPGLICLWNREALLSRGYWLQKFENFPEDPVLSGTFGISLPENMGEGCRCFAVLRCSGSDESKKVNFLAMVPNGDNSHVLFTELPEYNPT